MANLNDQAQKIIEIAEKHGVEQNFFFITTFKRYTQQLKYLGELEEMIDKESLSIEKTYVKGAKNTYIHPALSAYNKTCAEANKTVSTLVGIILKLRNRDDTDEIDPLLDYLTGRKPIPK